MTVLDVWDGISGGFTDLLRRGVSQFDRRSEREFLPAALEVLETPPSPAGRLVAIIIGLFFLIAVSWAFLGKVDVIATAPGRLLPAGKIKVIQPVDPGIVRAIHVQDGEHVRAGQLLIELDPTQSGADRDRLARDLTSTQLDVARLTALKRTAETGGAPGPYIPPPGAKADDIAQARAALEAQVSTSRKAKVAGLDQQISEKRAEEGEVTATIAKLNASMPLLAEKQRLHKQLHDQGFGTSFAYLDAQQALSEAQRDVSVEGQRAEQARADAASSSCNASSAQARWRNTPPACLADLLKALEQTERRDPGTWSSARARNPLRLNFSLADRRGGGELAVHTVRGREMNSGPAGDGPGARQPQHLIRGSPPAGRTATWALSTPARTCQGQDRDLQLHPLWSAPWQGASM